MKNFVHFEKFQCLISFIKMEVHEPINKNSKPPRKIRPPRYIFNESNDSVMSEIVDSISNGVPIDSVNPRIYGNLYPYLQMKCRYLSRDRNGVALRQVEDAMNKIQDYFIQIEADMIKKEQEYQEETRQLSPEEYQARLAAKEEARKNALNFTDNEIEECVQFALNEEFDKIDTRIVPLLLSELRKRQRNCITEENYNDASIYRAAAKSVGALSNGLRYEELTAAHIEELENRVMNASEDLDHLKRYWKQRIEDAKSQKEADISALRQEQAQKLAEFDKSLKIQQKQKARQTKNFNKSQNLNLSRNLKNTEKDKSKVKARIKTNTNKGSNSNIDNNEEVNLEGIPPQYCRYTNKVTELKKKEASLVSSKRFLEAIEARKEVEKQMRLEQLTFRRRYNEDLAVKRAEFIKKMQDKINVREQDAEAELNLLKREMNQQISQQQKTLHRYELQWQQAEELCMISKKCGSNSNSASVSGKAGDLDDEDGYYDNFENSGRSAVVMSSRDKDRMAEEVFRKRRAINAILYTRPQSARLPKIDKKY